MTLSNARTLWLSASAALAIAVLSGGPSVAAQAPKAPDTAILTESTLGPVTLSHKLHATKYGATCESCHHASKPQKALKTEHQKCSDCHTKVAAAPMKTKKQAAFHDAMAKKGTCVGCHVQMAAKGKTKVPVKCADCHKKRAG